MKVRVGTRRSKLALIQTEYFLKLARPCFPEYRFEVVPIETTGDKILDKNLYDIGGKALFLKEIEQAMLDGDVDIAVHSLKDVPGRITKGLIIGAVLEREDARDVLISSKYSNLKEIPNGAVIGTSSARRAAFLHQMNPSWQIIPFRGNVTTRLDKLDSGKAEATLLAACGLKRLGLMDETKFHYLEPSEFIPAAGQGIIGLQIAEKNPEMSHICDRLNYLPTWHLAQVERAYLDYLDANCDTPLSAYARYHADGQIIADFMMASQDWRKMRVHSEVSNINDATTMGIKAAKSLLKHFH